MEIKKLSKKKYFVFDLDDTLFNNDILERVLLKHNVDVNSFNLSFNVETSDLPQFIKDEVLSLYSNHIVMSQLRLNYGSLHTVQSLIKLDYIPLVCTARDDDHRKLTSNMVCSQLPIKKEHIYFFGSKPKSELLNNVNALYFADDHTKNIDDCLDNSNTIPFLISNSRTPHNHYLSDTYKHCNKTIIINELPEILKVVK